MNTSVDWDRVKGLKLPRINAYCRGAAVHKYIAAMAAVDEPQ